MLERLTRLGSYAVAGAALLLPPPAAALIELEGTTRATFEWPSASGPVAGYAVYVSFN